MKKDLDNLNNFWVNEWTEMAAVGANKNILSDPDSNQPHFLLKKDVGDAMAGNEQNESVVVEKTHADVNVCTDCDGNKYLKIYDLDSGSYVYEVIHRHHELEAVEESSSEEEKEAGNDDDFQSSEKPGGSMLEELHELWSKIEMYQATLKHGNTANPSSSDLEFQSVKSSKKRYIHVKKRAIAKARSEKTKYSLAHVENGSHYKNECHREKGSPRNTLSNENVEKPKACFETSQPSLKLNTF